MMNKAIIAIGSIFRSNSPSLFGFLLMEATKVTRDGEAIVILDAETFCDVAYTNSELFSLSAITIYLVIEKYK